MMVHKFAHNVDDLIAECEKALERASEKVKIRILAARAILKGKTTAEAADMFCVSPSSVNRWVRIVDTKGVDALQDRPKSGRPGKLSAENLEELDEVLKKPAHEVDPAYDVWDGLSLSDYISRTFSIAMSARNCCRIFRKLDYTQQRPQVFPSKGHEDEETRQAFMEEMEKMKQDPNVIPVFQDEVHIKQQTTVTVGWFKKASKPKIASYPGRASIALSGFVIPETGELFIARPERFTGETTIKAIRDFLKAHPPEQGKRFAICLDNAPWHRKCFRLVEKEARPEYNDIREKARLVLLPPYSPDLNPIEQVWRLIRKRFTHNRFFRSVAELNEVLSVPFARWSVPNDQLRSLCRFGASERAKKRHAAHQA